MCTRASSKTRKNTHICIHAHIHIYRRANKTRKEEEEEEAAIELTMTTDSIDDCTSGLKKIRFF